ncbi:unnamed protein product [Taenia asiatica]|uniref:MMS1_N domain-containing protein n=1 Tax=Taenia asiatica TaxID=60517 RepID=A0A0R3WE74_TAEAS|nr:unnamed protein product [Taenia asiatica]
MYRPNGERCKIASISTQLLRISVLATHSIPPLIESVPTDGTSIQVGCCEILGGTVPGFNEDLLLFHLDIAKCPLRALHGSRPSLRKRATQIITTFPPFEDTYTSLPAGCGMQSGQLVESRGTGHSYSQIALQHLLVLADGSQKQLGALTGATKLDQL